MRTLWLYLPLAWVLASCPVALAQSGQNSELDDLREEIRSMRAEYEARIADLEARLDAAERAADGGAAKTSSSAAAIAGTMDYGSSANPSPQTVSVARDSAFNPAIGVTFQGQAWSYDRDPGGYVIPGFPLGGEAGPAPEGLSLAETEISISANVDDKFTAMLNAPIVIEDGDVHVELEEAWVETLGLPAGLAVRMGRFFSDIGYLNTRHFHAWDFADQPLVYQVFLGQQYLDDGLQLRWLAPTDFYLELGGEILRGGIGAALLAQESGAPLVPVGFYVPDQFVRIINLKRESWVSSGRWQLGGRCYIQVGKVLKPESVNNEERNYRNLREVTEDIMETIRSLVRLAEESFNKGLEKL